MRYLSTTAMVACLSLGLSVAAAQEAGAEAEAQWRAWAAEFEAGLDRRTGDVIVARGEVLLSVPDGYYYLDKQDARAVLEDAWGNPEDDSTLGMIFPAGLSPLDEDVYGVNLTYDRDGYVSDEEASEIDYDDLLADMQRATEGENGWRVENGYGRLDLVGWAEQPAYDPASNKMVWAKQLRFEGSEQDTLNYNVRALGRRGVVQANFIAGMDQLSQVREAAPEVMDMIFFTSGNQYADYQDGDRVAAYGIAGMVAGGAVLAKKTGLIALVLVFAKKFAVVGLAAAAGLFGAARKFFSSKG